MIITKTPYRISFFGGGTDYPAWYNEHGGKVLATTIDKYIRLSARFLPPFFEHKYRIVYSKIEEVVSPSQIEHPAVRAVFEYLNWKRGIELHYDGDLPARSGMGSSSAFVVGLLNSLMALKGRIISKEFVAQKALFIEQNILKENVGSQDQLCAAYGGFNKIVFNKGGTYEVQPVILPKRRLQQLESHLLLVFTGFTRISSNVAKQHVQQLDKNAVTLTRMEGMVEDALGIVQSQNGTMSDFGKLLNEAWQCKRSLTSAVSKAPIDEIYQEARAAGAIGGKLLGAGGGGFLLLFVKPEERKKVTERLNKLIQVPFGFEGLGSRVVLCQMDELDETDEMEEINAKAA